MYTFFNILDSRIDLTRHYSYKKSRSILMIKNFWILRTDISYIIFDILLTIFWISFCFLDEQHE